MTLLGKTFEMTVPSHWMNPGILLESFMGWCSRAADVQKARWNVEAEVRFLHTPPNVVSAPVANENGRSIGSRARAVGGSSPLRRTT